MAMKIMERNTATQHRLLYAVDQNPPLLMTILLAVQQFAVSSGGCISSAAIIAGLICVGNQPLVQAKLLNTFFLISGIGTFIQTTFGVRIPTLQSSGGSFLVVVGSLMASRADSCPASSNQLGNSTNMTGHGGEIWQIRIQEIQGAIMLAGLSQFAVGMLGIVGFLTRFIGPITVAVTIMSIALQVAHFALQLCQTHWGISLLTVSIILVCSMYLRNWSPKISVYVKGTCRTYAYPCQKVLSVLIAVVLVWLLCFILSMTGIFSNDRDDYNYAARTDRISNVINDAQWIYIPYPGQWGMPSFSLPSYLAMLIPTVASILESIGDYHACAKACDLPPPPLHAINRGVCVEGIGSFLAGAFGGGGSITSYSQNSGVINLTKAGSRIIFQVSALLFIIFGVFGKLGAALTALPTPIVGGTFLASVAMIFGVSLGNLSHVNIQSPRNQMIIGLSVIMGIIIPIWMENNAEIITTGITLLDDILNVLLKTSMFIAGFLACILDNTIPGTKQERGLDSWRSNEDASPDDRLAVYNLPFIMPCLRRHGIFTYIPICPVYRPRPCHTCKGRPNKSTDGIDSSNMENLIMKAKESDV